MIKKQMTSFFLGVFLILSGYAAAETISTKTITTSITSEPSNAEIYWGNVENGLIKTTFTTPYLEQNSMQGAIWRDWYYQIKKEGYKDSEVIFQSETNEDRSLHFDLQPLEVVELFDFKKGDYQYSSTVLIISEPSEASVFLTGKLLGETPLKSVIYWRDSLMSYELRLEKTGFVSKQAVLRPSDVLTTIVLQPFVTAP